MKVEIVQTASPTVTGNYDITGTTPSSDMVGAIFWEGIAAGNGNNISGYRFSVGATDLANNISLGMAGNDAVTNAAIQSSMSNVNCVSMPGVAAGTIAPVAAYLATLANGVRLNLTSAPATGRLTFTLLISGTDTAMKVGSVQFANADTSHVITHGLGGTPDVLIILTSMDQNGTDNGGYGQAIGFWDRASASQNSVSYMAVSGAATTNNAEIATNNSVGEIINSTASAVLSHLTVGSVGATTFTLSLNASAGIPNMIGWIALRGTTAQMFSGNVLTTMPTANGTANFINGLLGRPQVLFTVPTRLTTGNTLKTDDSAGGFGLGGMATDDYSNTTMGAVSVTWQDGVATSVGRNMQSNLRGIQSSLNTGANDIAASMSGGTWDTGGVTPNYTNTDATAFEAIGLAFGMPGGVTLPLTPITRTQFFVEDRVTYFP